MTEATDGSGGSALVLREKDATDGEALLIGTPGFSFLDLPKAIWFFLAEDRYRFLLCGAVLFMTMFYMMVPPFVIGKIADHLIRTAQGEDLARPLLYFWVALLAGGFVLISLLRLTAKRSLGKFSLNARYRAKVWGFEHLLSHTLAWHHGEAAGNKAQRVITGSEAVHEWTGALLHNILSAVSAFVGSVVACMYLHPAFGLFFVYYLSGLLAVEAWFDRRIERVSDQINQSIENASGSFFESASNVLAVKALGLVQGLTGNIANREDRARRLAVQRLRLSTSKWICFQIHNGLAWGIFILIIVWMVENKILAVGFVFTYAAYFSNTRESATELTDQIQTIIERKSSLGRMMPLFCPAHKDGKAQTMGFPAAWETISAHDLRFRYATTSAGGVGPLDFSISRGQKIGVAGPSGSGKSTLVKLLLGLYEGTQGELRIGTTPVSRIRHEDLVSHVAVVLQDTEIFGMSLKDNITLTREVDTATLQKAIELACLQDLIERLPQRIDTAVGEKGASLSGGERQRIGIARAICRNAPIVVLDEATSALDFATERRIMEGLFGDYAGGRTLIVIAHRLSSLREADRILVFDNGQIVEEGRFDELCEDGRTQFGRMYALQHRGTGLSGTAV